jgi:hypothetical protein
MLQRGRDSPAGSWFPNPRRAIHAGSGQHGAISLRATASDIDGVVTNLAFLINGLPVATGTNSTFTNSVEIDVPGDYVIQARALDDKGAASYATTNVTVVSSPPEVLSLGGFRTNRAFKVCMLGLPGRSYELLANTNLNTTNWLSLGPMDPTNAMWRFFDRDATNFPQRYYRARQLP